MPYCEKVWGDPCHLVSPDFDCQAIREPASAVEHFLYPRLGIGGFSQRLGEGVGRKRILTGSKVTRIGVEAGRISFVECGNPPFKHRVTAQEYLSSIPLPRLVPLIDPPAPAAVQQAAHVLENRNLVTVNLLIDRPSFNDASWIHVQEPRVRTARIIEPRNLSPEMAPEGKTSLVVEFACGGGDDIWSAPPDRNLGMAEHELTSKLELVGRDEILSGHVRRWQDAYPACNLGYQEHRQTVLDYLSTIANLRLIGRNGRHRYGDLGHSIEMGLKAALNVMGEDFDLEAVNAPPSDPERYPYFPALDQEWVNSQSTLVPSLRDKEDMAAAMAAK